MSVESRSQCRSGPGNLGHASVKIGRGSPGQPGPACCKKHLSAIIMSYIKIFP